MKITSGLKIKVQTQILSMAKLIFSFMLMYPAVCPGGDRVFYNGAIWLQNRTISQLEGFDVIRLSSNVLNRARIDSITRIEKKKLMIGLANNHMSLNPGDWPDNILAYSHPDSTKKNPIRTFRDSLEHWSEVNLEIAHVFYNNEWPYKTTVDSAISRGIILASDTLSTGKWTPKAVSGLHAKIIHKYKSILTEFYPNAKLWVFGSAHEVNIGNPDDPTDDDPNYEYRRHGIDWEAISTGPNAPDFACLGVTVVSNPQNDYEYHLNVAKEDVRDTAPLLNSMLIAPSFGTANVLDPTPPWPTIRNTYQNNWENFKTFIRTVKTLVDSANNNISSPNLWYQIHYLDGVQKQHIGTPDPSGSGNYTNPPPSANNFVKPFRDIPYADGYDYPARFWEDGASNWDWSRSVNQWEAEMVANYLKATGYDVPGRQITSNTTWSNEIVLAGDVEVISGVTLTIQPGTRIFLRPNTDVYESGAREIEIVIKQGGTLTANGTLNAPIIFQSSLNIDTYDSPGKDDWGGIKVEEGGALTLQHCEIYDAKVGVDVEPIISTVTTIDIAETDFIHNYTGVKLDHRSQFLEATLDNVLFHDNLNGLDIYSDSSEGNEMELINATIAGNHYGISVVSRGSSGHQFTVKNTIIDNNDYGIDAGYGGSPVVNVKYSDFYANSTALYGDLSGWSVPPSSSDHSGNNDNHDYDPSFVDEDEDDFHLQATSDLIDEGDPTMREADNSTINMGRYGGTAEYTSVSSGDGTSSTKPTVLKTEDTPLVFSLSQNAPNPFNPETIISYSLPQSEQVKLVIYNVLGQQIRTLVNAFKPAGRYRVVWNSKDDFGHSVSSGIYFYQITAGEFLDTRKMLILK